MSAPAAVTVKVPDAAAAPPAMAGDPMSALDHGAGSGAVVCATDALGSASSDTTTIVHRAPPCNTFGTFSSLVTPRPRDGVGATRAAFAGPASCTRLPVASLALARD